MAVIMRLIRPLNHVLGRLHQELVTIESMKAGI